MRKIALAVILVACAQAQGYGDYLPHPIRMTGVVVDSQGQPITGANIDNTGEDPLQTGSDGRFELKTTAPAMVAWKAGYRSKLQRTQAADVRIELQKELRKFPICSPTGSYLGSANLSPSLLQFVNIKGVAATPQEHARESDGFGRYYYLETQPPTMAIMHFSGLTPRVRRPSDPDVWHSIKYEETTFTVGDRTIVDANGEDHNGNRWRSLTVNGELVLYSGADAETAKRLDQVLDSACLASALP
jgi:hypothetical protein